MIPKPLKGLSNGPQLSELLKDQRDGLTNPLVWVKNDLAERITNVTDRKSLKQLTTAGLGFLASLQTLAKQSDFNNAEGSLDSQDKLIVHLAQVVELLFIADYRVEELTNLQ
jgi:hypothetical protein